MYVNEMDRTIKRRVSEPKLNDLFREALKYDSSLMIEEYSHIERIGWFGKRQITTRYNIFHETPAHDGAAYQARYQISGSGEKSIVIAYLHGIINGALHSITTNKPDN